MNYARQIVTQLKEADQDHEWYPTTPAMIEAVKRWISAENTNSIMDIGAGDGRVLVALGEKRNHPLLYSIEISPILRQEQPEDIIPVGTDLFEQNLAALPVDYIFCNPPYSQYEEWVCKIIEQGFAIKAFLVIPQRWKDSPAISEAIKRRGATARAIYHDDFLQGDRAARAIIDIVEVTFPLAEYGRGAKDPFEIWFDSNISTFDKADEIKEPETESSLARRLSNSSIDEMVESYLAEFKILRANYEAVFHLDYAILKELGIDKKAVREGLKMKMQGLKAKYWHVLFERMDAITSRLSTKSKDKLMKKITANTSVEFTASNAYAIVLWAIKNANQYFDEQLTDLFFELSTFEGVMNYKSNVRVWDKEVWRYNDRRSGREYLNSHYKLDYRIVVKRWKAICTDRYDRWNYPGGLSQDSHNLIADAIAVMGNLGFQTESLRSIDRHWTGGKWQDFYLSNTDDILFQVKAYMNGNMHFRFNQTAIMALNVNAARLLKWVRTKEEAAEELGYTHGEVDKYFNRNTHILPNNIKLLGA